jgi:hypothetical protein
MTGFAGMGAVWADGFPLERPDQERTGEWVDVRTFGAVGDGRADDLVPIQTAIDFLAGSRGIVHLPTGRYRCSGTLNAKRSHLRGSGPPPNSGGGGTVLSFPHGGGIRSSTQDNFGFEVSFLQLRGVGSRAQSGQTLLDFTGQNYPRVRECRIGYTDIGMRLQSGRTVECHYGAFFNVHFDRCRVGVHVGNAHSQKFFGGRFWNCVVGVRNERANDVALFGSEFESDVPVLHPEPIPGWTPTTTLLGCRVESRSAPVIMSGAFFDSGSYWSGYRRATELRIDDGESVQAQHVRSIGASSDNQPVRSNLLRNPGLIPGPDESQIPPGWEAPPQASFRSLYGPLGRILEISVQDATPLFLAQPALRLGPGRYVAGIGVQRSQVNEGTFIARLKIFDRGSLINEGQIPGNYYGGIYTRGFSIEGTSDDVEFRLELEPQGSRVTAFLYAPFLAAGRHAERYTQTPQDGRPFELRYGSAPPSSGRWAVGDTVVNIEPTEQGRSGERYVVERWRCVASGRPGEWVGLRMPTGR